MIRTIHNFILILTLLCTALAATGQNIRLEKSPDLQVDASISKEELSQIITTLEATLNEYAQAATLVDTLDKRVTEKSIDRFNALFAPGAKIDRDFVEFFKGELIEYKDYSLEVINRLELKGVDVVIKKMELKEVKADGQDFYVPIVILTKERYIFVSSNGTIEPLSYPETFKQELTLDIAKDYPDEANIAQIKHYLSDKDRKKTKNKGLLSGNGFTDDYTRILSIPIGVGRSFYNTSMSDYWNTEHFETDLSSTAGNNYSIGFEILTNRLITPKASSDRKLSFSLGLQYNSYGMNTSVDSFVVERFDTIAVSTLDPTDIQPYARFAQGAYVDEKLRFNTISIPIGIARNLVDKQRLKIYAHLRLIPTYTLGVQGNLSGTGRYNAQRIINGIRLNEFILSENSVDPATIGIPSGHGDYDVGLRQIIDISAKPPLNKLTFALQFSPTAYFNLSDENPGTGIMAGLDISYRFNSLIKHEPISATLENPLKYNDDFDKGSLLNYFADDMSALNIGLRIGIFRILNIEP